MKVRPLYLFIAACVFSALLFCFHVLKSNYKPFWIDETYTIFQSIPAQTVSEFFIDGAQGQGSKAPLYYVLEKVFHNIRHDVNYLYLHAHSYYRFLSFSSIILSGLAIFLFISWKGPPQYLKWIAALSVLAFLHYNLNFINLHFSNEVRPYALWNCFYFLSLLAFLFRPDKIWLQVTFMILLAWTATASIFQILSLGLSYVLVQFILQKDLKTIALRCFQVFFFPFCESLYYCLTSEVGGFPEADIKEFTHFWLGNFEVPVFTGLAVAVCSLKPKTRIYAIPALSLFILYFVSPFIFGLTYYKGFFFSSRQYIYYILAFSILCLTIIQCLPFWSRVKFKPMKRYAVVALVIMIGGLALRDTWRNSYKYYLGAKASKNLGLDHYDRDGLLLNYLTKARPNRICVDKSLDGVSRSNLIVIAQWVDTYYSFLPQVNTTLHFKKTEAGGAYTHIDTTSCQGEDSIPVNAGNF